MSPTSIVAYLALFVGVGGVFLFANMLVGKFLRPHNPSPEKEEVYECGEPTIGSAFVQFDLRFYVVALLFIIFDVEVAFFFPWALVFGKATQLMHADATPAAASQTLTELGVPVAAQGDMTVEMAQNTGSWIGWMSIGDIGVFFAVLLVGFAYVWRRGDLDWVRALSREKAAAGRPRLADLEDEPVLAA
jgi:NADH-quinone oxidoreductase subunit A